MKDSTTRHIARATQALVSTVLLTFCVAAQALIIETQQGLELDPSMITMPGTDNGTLRVKQCAECERQDLKTTADGTQYLIRDQAGKTEILSRQDFSAALRLIDNRDALVMVFYSLDTNTVIKARLNSNTPVNAPATNRQTGGANGAASSQPATNSSENNRPAPRTGGFSR